MSQQHVHVRVRRDMAVSDDGELVERYACRCGASWTKTYGAPPGPE
ncbi:hypothetical protein [Streptomyces sp. TRM49041]|nr:hypothetical protein [Streptomyces sp. TRM49041]